MDYLFCPVRDLSTDADLYAGAANLTRIRNLNRVGDGDTLILYTHGVYYEASGGTTPKASNEVEWGNDGDHINATTAALNLVAAGLTPPVNNLTLIVHACFSAGALEKLPRQTKQLLTFAGQLCSAMKGTFPGICVIGYQGETKVGKAGFLVGGEPERKRRKRGDAADPHDADNFAVHYMGAAVGIQITYEGAAVAWR